MSEGQRPDTAADLRRIHAMITHALEGARAQSQAAAEAGLADPGERQALAEYLGCFATLLHDHHLSEDDVAFPYFRDRLPDAPFGALEAQHVEMQALLEELEAACDVIARNGQGREAAQALHDTLGRLAALWHPHIALEEAQFTPETLDGAGWGTQDAAQFAAAIGAYMQQLIDPQEMQRCQAILAGAG